MTTGQIMMKLWEIEANLDHTKATSRTGHRLTWARSALSALIEDMLADDRRHAEARTMGEMPFDGGERVKP